MRMGELKVAKRIFRQYGWLGIIRVLIYPLTSLITTPIRLIQTLWECRLLFYGRWGDYIRFNSYYGLNSLFYWRIALDLYRYGRTGISPNIGLGKYKLARCFHYALPSLYLFKGASTVTVLTSMFLWWLSHLVWMKDCTVEWLIVVMTLSLISTTFYSNIFLMQNYNAVGWIFFPLGLYGLITGHWIVAAVAWFGASFGSITVVFIAGLLSIVYSIKIMNFWPLIAILPAAIKLSTHLFSLLKGGDFKNIILDLIKGIGLKKTNTRYQRKKTFGLIHIYYLILYFQFSIALMLIKPDTAIVTVFLAGVGIFLANHTVARFADWQSMMMMMASLALIIIFQSQEPYLLPFFWLLISPLPLLCPIVPVGSVFDIVPKLSPFYVKPLLAGMEQFLTPVENRRRVLINFEDPEGDYDKIFDGYRVLLELLLYVGTKNNIHVMPDWNAVFETNYVGAPEFWGRDILTVGRNVKQWEAAYVIIYQEAGTPLDKEWEKAGYQVLSTFDWSQYEYLMHPKMLEEKEIPCWWLLRVPANIAILYSKNNSANIVVEEASR